MKRKKETATFYAPKELREALAPKKRRVYGRRRYTRMKAEREKLGLSLREVSERVGFSNPFLCQVENGLVEPKLRNAIKLAKFYGVRAEELLETVSTADRK